MCENDVRAILSDEVKKLKVMSDRQNPEKDGRGRNDFQRDYARILYSSSFRRLQGKMQMIGLNSARYYRNRLTHSLEVSQIAKGIAIKMNDKYSDNNNELWGVSDLYVIDAISLAHDLGNPPFGHAGERVLNELIKKEDGFEGNAQTLRILRTLERKFPDIGGLNLTERTLLGVVKYFFRNNGTQDKFLYSDDYDIIEKIYDKHGISYHKTLDCQIMDLADEIAYAAHDLEDALHQRLINPYDLIFMFKKEIDEPRILKGYNANSINIAKYKFEEILNKALDFAYESKKMSDTDDVFEAIFRKDLISEIVNTLIDDIVFDGEKKEFVFKEYDSLALGLKRLLFNCIKNDSEQILFYENRGNNIIKGLYYALVDDKFNGKNKLLSAQFKDGFDESTKERRIIDYIAGMMDSYAVEVYEKFYGKNSSDVYYKKVD